MISVLINSWKRPENVIKILNKEKDYKVIDEIIVFNNNPEIYFDYEKHDKVKIINTNRDLGLRTRWTNATLATNECLLYQDDDIIIEEDGCDTFWRFFESDPERIYCASGRVPDSDGTYNYINATGPVEVVITSAACLPRSLIPYVLSCELDFYSKWELKNKTNDFHEDIFLSYCAMSVFGQRNLQVPIKLKRLPDKHAIHRRPTHRSERTEMVRRCRRFFTPMRTVIDRLENYLQNLPQRQNNGKQSRKQRSR